MKKHFLLLSPLLLLTGCGSNTTTGNTSKPSDNNTVGNTTATENNTGTMEGKTMIVYFSASNHTEKVATTIGEHLNVTPFVLEPVEPYSSADLNYSNSNSRVVKEHEDSNRHVELKKTSFDGFNEATNIFLGAPVWWQEMSWVINDFVKDNDFTGKTIIPFATSASSNYRVDNLKTLNDTGTWLEPKRFSSNVASSDVISWVDSLSL